MNDFETLTSLVSFQTKIHCFSATIFDVLVYKNVVVKYRTFAKIADCTYSIANGRLGLYRRVETAQHHLPYAPAH